MTTSATSSDPKEIKIPAALLVVGLLIYLAHSLLFAGPAGVAPTLILIALSLTLQVILGLIACLCVAKVTGAVYGTLLPACLKLAAIFIFPGAVSVFIPISILAWIVSLILYWGLIEWLFELEPVETILTVFAIWLTQIAAFLLAVIILASSSH